MGKSLEDSPSSCTMRSSVLLAAFFIISWSSMSSTLATSDVEGGSIHFSIKSKRCQGFKLVMGMLKPISQSPLMPNASTMTPIFFSSPFLSVRGFPL